MDFHTSEALTKMGIRKFGDNVQISKHAIIYNPENIVIGSNVRIDALCILSPGSGFIHVGDFVHIAARTSIFGAYGVVISDHAQIASNCTILSATDDFSGEYLVGPTVPDKYRKITGGTVYLGRAAVIGANSIILPNSFIGNGSALGAFTLVLPKQVIPVYSLFAGVPAKRLKERSKRHVDLALSLHRELEEADMGNSLDLRHTHYKHTSLPTRRSLLLPFINLLKNNILLFFAYVNRKRQKIFSP